MLGISVYFKDFDEQYISSALAEGVTDVFTSLHIPEENLSDVKGKFLLLNDLCAKHGANLIPDISPIVYEKLGVQVSDNSVFKKLGIRKLRLDFGFDDPQKIKEFQADFDLVLNASTLNQAVLEEAKSAGVDFSRITFMHNFYPKVNTGLSKESLTKKNAVFAKMGVKTSAFVPGDMLKRFPFYQGLPTLEKHRGQNPFVSAIELLRETNTSGVLIGDSKAKISTLKYINSFQQKGIINLPTCLEHGCGHLRGKQFSLRSDLPENVLRLISKRTPVPIGKTIERHRGTITVENELAGRYSGEFEIAKKDIGFSATSNFVGMVLPEYQSLLDLIEEKDTIIL